MDRIVDKNVIVCREYFQCFLRNAVYDAENLINVIQISTARQQLVCDWLIK